MKMQVTQADESEQIKEIIEFAEDKLKEYGQLVEEIEFKKLQTASEFDEGSLIMRDIGYLEKSSGFKQKVHFEFMSPDKKIKKSKRATSPQLYMRNVAFSPQVKQDYLPLTTEPHREFET